MIRNKRLEFDASATDLAQSLMAIRKTTTASGRSVTYDAGRASETGHADLAWALMHALDWEPWKAPQASEKASWRFTDETEKQGGQRCAGAHA